MNTSEFSERLADVRDCTRTIEAHYHGRATRITFERDEPGDLLLAYLFYALWIEASTLDN